MALESLERPAASRRSPEEKKPVDPNKPKAGANWSPEEEQQLRDAFAAHQPIPEIAQAHGRTPGAITSRLVKLGLIEDPMRNRAGAGNRPPRAAVTFDGSRVPPHPAPSALPAELPPEEEEILPF